VNRSIFNGIFSICLKAVMILSEWTDCASELQMYLPRFVLICGTIKLKLLIRAHLTRLVQYQ